MTKKKEKMMKKMRLMLTILSLVLSSMLLAENETIDNPADTTENYWHFKEEVIYLPVGSTITELKEDEGKIPVKVYHLTEEQLKGPVAVDTPQPQGPSVFAVDEEGNIYIRVGGGVKKYDSKGNYIRTYDFKGWRMTVHRDTLMTVVRDTRNNVSLYRYSLDGDGYFVDKYWVPGKKYSGGQYYSLWFATDYEDNLGFFFGADFKKIVFVDSTYHLEKSELSNYFKFSYGDKMDEKHLLIKEKGESICLNEMYPEARSFRFLNEDKFHSLYIYMYPKDIGKGPIKLGIISKDGKRIENNVEYRRGELAVAGAVTEPFLADKNGKMYQMLVKEEAVEIHKWVREETKGGEK